MTADEGMRPRGRHAPPRDQRESAFTAILTDLVERVPGARCAALVDRDGETVDYGGRGSPYEMRVAAAHLRIVFDEALSYEMTPATTEVLPILREWPPTTTSIRLSFPVPPDAA